ncbi:MAG: hypothetical protein HC888_10425 [Candidatus Competibacteraceae bacterium]|nr:hypothetical protein [Candidatus Competibacteraceae bacterium]
MIAGLILYGLIIGKSSLRELEQLASESAIAWWLTGGIEPDHSTIGLFLIRHEAWLFQVFIPQMTSMLFKQIPKLSRKLAADGTTMEAVSSRFVLLGKEAKEEAQRARKKADEDPGNSKKQTEADRLEKAAQIVAEYTDKKHEKGNNNKQTYVARHEPEALNLSLKRGLAAPAYKPTVLVNEQRLIVANTVVQTRETDAILPLLEDFEALEMGEVEELLLDAGFRKGALFKLLVEREVDVLCPSGSYEKKGTYTGSRLRE